MTYAVPLWTTPRHHLVHMTPDHPVQYLSPTVLRSTAEAFQTGFPGLVTYAVKANDTDVVLENLMTAGIAAFDVASPDEMRRIRRLLPGAVLHYNNPVRSLAEIDVAVALGVTSYSVDQKAELAKLKAGGVPVGTEVSVRLALPVSGAAYDFGAKFGVDEDKAVLLLKEVSAAGYAPALTFHPGTQCEDAGAWAAYIQASARVADKAGVTLQRLNVGGGFPANRGQGAPDLGAVFETITQAVDAAFGARPPALVCEPGRAMVAEAFSHAARVKAIRDDGSVVLNDGIYGGFAEVLSMGVIDRLEVIDAEGRTRREERAPRVVWGPTCDSLDRFTDPLPLPGGVKEGDWVLFHGTGAYSTATATRFNGYGDFEVITVRSLI